MKHWLASVEDAIAGDGGYDSGTKEIINEKYRVLMFHVEDTMTSNDYTDKQRLERINGLIGLMKRHDLSLV